MQIVVRGGIELPEYDTRRFIEILQDADYDQRHATRELYHYMHEQPFKWELHDKCLAICHTHNIYPNGYRFYRDEPKRPTNLAEGLAYLTIPEIKPLLKARKLKVGGKKDDLIQRLNEVARFEEVADVCLEKYQENQADWKRKCIYHAYELLVRMIVNRAYFLHRKDQILELQAYKKDKYLLKGVNLPNHAQAKAEEQLMAKLVDGTGYEDVIIDNKLCKLLPIYPSGASTIDTERSV